MLGQGPSEFSQVVLRNIFLKQLLYFMVFLSRNYPYFGRY